ncbi:MAG TPA: EamA family transporter [Candidatus Polarisedimenticolia bacterium]|nr:EamA family transporter [Candidatus Polarisedimenticolia bacterium]
MLFAAMLMGASAFPGIRAALDGYSPYHLALLRFVIASLTLAVLAVVLRVRVPRREDLPRLILLGFLGFAFYHVALNCGEMTVTAGAASFIICTVPIFNVALSMLILAERLRPAAWTGMAVSMFGVALITLGENGGLEPSAGALLILAAAVAQSLYFVLQKPLLENYSAFEVVCYGAWSGTGFLLVFTPGLFDAVLQATSSATWSVVYLGMVPGALAYLGWSYALAEMGVSRMSSYLYLIPVLAMIIGYLWLGEVPTGLALLGGPITLAGVVLAGWTGQSASVSSLPSAPDEGAPAAGCCE